MTGWRLQVWLFTLGALTAGITLGVARILEIVSE